MQKIYILGVEIDLLTIEQLNEIISRCIETDQRQIIAHHNLHSIYLYHKQPKFRSLYAVSDFIHIDGMSLIFWAKLLGHRVRSAQWFVHRLCCQCCSHATPLAGKNRF